MEVTLKICCCASHKIALQVGNNPVKNDIRLQQGKITFRSLTLGPWGALGHQELFPYLNVPFCVTMSDMNCTEIC